MQLPDPRDFRICATLVVTELDVIDLPNSPARLKLAHEISQRFAKKNGHPGPDPRPRLAFTANSFFRLVMGSASLSLNFSWQRKPSTATSRVVREIDLHSVSC